MKTDVGVIKTVADPVAAPAAPVVPAEKAKRSAPEPASMPELSAIRLVIEEDRQSGSFVYKTLDRVTGEVLSQYPREEVLRMLTRSNYAAGDVIKTRA